MIWERSNIRTDKKLRLRTRLNYGYKGDNVVCTVSVSANNVDTKKTGRKEEESGEYMKNRKIIMREKKRLNQSICFVLIFLPIFIAGKNNEIYHSLAI